MSTMTESYPLLVRHGVLVALDLILINERNEVLLGHRNNAPARGFYFVPGGSIRKGETAALALKRIARQEVGIEVKPEQFILQGIYDHLYSESAFDANTSTQYVVIACRGAIHSETLIVPDFQHKSLIYMHIDEVMSSPEVHQYTKNYFLDRPENLFLESHRGTDI